MKNVIVSIGAATFVAGFGMASMATAQENTTVVRQENADGDSKTVMHKDSAYGGSKTVVHKESADGEHSKTMVSREDGSKTIVKRGEHHMKRVDIEPNGDKAVTEKEKSSD